MSIEMKKYILISLNVWIGVSYMILSVIGARIFMTIGNAVTDKYLNGKAVPVAVAGSALFLFGCGVHHLHLGFHMVPQGVTIFEERSLWMAMFNENLVIQLAQAIGAPLLLVAGWSMNRRAKKLAALQAIAARRGVDIW